VPAAGIAVLEALREPRYRRLWVAGVVLNVARWTDFVVLGWLALELTDSPFFVGLAGFCRAVPMLGFGPLAGVVADRVDRGRVMIAVQLLNVTAAALLLLLFATGLGRYGPLVLVEVLFGIAWAIDFPARQSVLYTLVGPARVTNAISLESVSLQGARMLGAGAGGVLLAHVGPAGCYAFITVLYGAALGLVVSLARRVALPPAAPRAPLAGSLAAGVREAVARPAIRAVLLITVLMNTLVFPYQHILAVFARDVLLVGPERLGLLVAAEGLGALAGSLVIAGWRGFAAHGLVFAGGSFGVAVLVVAFALSPWFAVAVALQLLIGVGEAGFGTMQSTIVLLAAPEPARGRVLGILSACIGSQPFGALWIGFLAGQAGAPVAAAAGALAAAVLMAPIAVRMAGRDVSSSA
jgi:predicted MFS family arabinose efflux permease